MRIFRVLAFLCVAAVINGCGGSVGTTTTVNVPPPTVPGSPTPGSNPTSAGTIPVVQHVVVVVLENTNFTDANNTTNMPYLNSLLAKGSLAATYYADFHPSIPNYMTLTTGLSETFDDSFAGTISDDNVVRRLTAAGKTWKAYEESIPSAGYLGADLPPYKRAHDPFSFFSDVQQASTQAANIVPFSQFSADLSAGTLPNYSFVVPNLTDDAHDCPGGATLCAPGARLQPADQWLRANIDPLVNSAAFNQGGLLIITFDESENDITNGGGHVMTVLLGTHVKQGFSGSAATYDHRSLLDLSMEALGVMSVPNGASSAARMTEFFQ